MAANWDDLSDSSKAGRLEHCNRMKKILMTEPDGQQPCTHNSNMYYNSVVFSDEVMVTLDGGRVKVSIDCLTDRLMDLLTDCMI